MAWRPGAWVLEGELDNTTFGWTVGWIKLLGREEPLQLKLAGNCGADLAGWKFEIVRTDPIPDWLGPPEHPSVMQTVQSGNVGVITADQVLKHFECSDEEFVERQYAGDEVPTVWREALYLEWFSTANGRVVIQSTRLAIRRQGTRAFELTEAETSEQARRNAEETMYFLNQIADAMTDQGDADVPDDHR